MGSSDKHSLKVTFVSLDKEGNAVGDPTEYILEYDTCRIIEFRETSPVFDMGGSTLQVQTGKTILDFEGVVRG